MRNFQLIVGAGIGVLFGASLVPQTLLLGKYRRVLASYKDGEEEVTSADLVALKDKVWSWRELMFYNFPMVASPFPPGFSHHRVAGTTDDLPCPRRPVRLLARSQSSTFPIIGLPVRLMIFPLHVALSVSSPVLSPATMTDDLPCPRRPVRLLARSQSSTSQVLLAGVFLSGFRACSLSIP